jgi:hypothetical protein
MDGVAAQWSKRVRLARALKPIYASFLFLDFHLFIPDGAARQVAQPGCV